MRCPSLKELPPPPEGKAGWPWTEESPQLSDTMSAGQPWPKISIIIPSYNQCMYLEETIRSGLLQNYPNLELILIDGASKDGSDKIITKYKQWISYWVSEPDKGQSYAINKGLRKCTGEIITWISSDDLYLPGAFYEVGSRWPQSKHYGVIVGAFYFMDEASKIEKIKYPPRLPHPGPLDLSITPPQDWRLHQVSTFYTRNALDNVGRYVREDLRYNMDRELLFRICQRHKTFLINDALAAFRRQNASKSWSISNMIPMSCEFAQIYYLFLTTNNKDNKQRKKIAGYFKAKGYVKYAKYSSNILSSLRALFTVLFYKPSFIIQKDYLLVWLKLLRILSFLQRLKKIIIKKVAQ